jgi:hypothetical protein
LLQDALARFPYRPSTAGQSQESEIQDENLERITVKNWMFDIGSKMKQEMDSQNPKRSKLKQFSELASTGASGVGPSLTAP